MQAKCSNKIKSKPNLLFFSFFVRTKGWRQSEDFSVGGFVRQKMKPEVGGGETNKRTKNKKSENKRNERKNGRERERESVSSKSKQN